MNLYTTYFPSFMLTLLFCCYTARTDGQAIDSGKQEVPVLVHTLAGPFIDFEVDNLGNIYLVGSQQQILKRSPALDSLAVYNDKRNFGKLHSIDVSNPLKVLLFFRDYGTIVILDRFFNVRTVLNLRTAGILQASAITQSFDNNIWLYDELDNMVKKVDESGRVLTNSPDFRILFEDPPAPQTLCDFNRFLYAYDSVKGLLVMDYYGAYKNKISFTGWQNVHSIAKGITATDMSGLVYYEPGTLNTRSLRLPAYLLAHKKIRVEGKNLYALAQSGELNLYRLP